MKTKFTLLTLLTLLMLFTATFNYAQTSAEIADIAVQGIARDNNNTAITNNQISLTFTIYYNNPGPVDVYVENKPDVDTDAFGVFSHILNVDPDINAKFAKYQMWLRIEDSNGIISNEKSKHVPYAITANNGVPTGSIMPYMGAAAPTGWVLCDGRTLTNIDGTAELEIVLGVTNVPDLRGFFLRGAGTNGLTSVTTTRGATQDDTNKSHTHGDNIAVASGGAHTHTVPDYYVAAVNVSGGHAQSGSNRSLGFNTRTTSSSGAHGHTVTGGIYADGGSESRPVNYGVNYIIKL